VGLAVSKMRVLGVSWVVKMNRTVYFLQKKTQDNVAIINKRGENDSTIIHMVGLLRIKNTSPSLNNNNNLNN
jgi:hypothetical protein